MSHFVAQLGGMTHFTVKYTVPDHKHTIMISDIKFGPLVTTQEPNVRKWAVMPILAKKTLIQGVS